MRNNKWTSVLSIIGLVLVVPLAQAQEDESAELAKKLANPVASMISLPMQYNYDEYGGVNEDGAAHLLTLQPVIPIPLTENWNLITRTIVPLIDRQDFALPAMNESGLGDIVASQYFSPKAPTAGGWIWGVGPAELLPTASDELLGGDKWGLGPTGVALRQTGPWTVGILASHIWSVAGDSDRADISSTSLQPFLSYITTTKTTIGIYTETAYDWENQQWSVPVIGQVAQLFKIGPQIMQLAAGAKYWAESSDDGPEGWGLRIQLTLLFPK